MRGAWLLTLALAAAPALARAENELRDLQLGIPAAALPAQGYTGFACAAGGAALGGWGDWRRCPADAETGWHEVRFRYDEAASELARSNERYAGTKVGGQPVLLSVLVGGGGEVEGLRIRTDPGARLFERKKAFLFGEQVKHRYGEEDWTCHQADPAPEEEPVGGVFVREHCDKLTPTRHLILDRWLYRHPGEDIRRFAGGSEVTILRRR